MSVLAWVFAAGGLTVVLPILFHIIRRPPRDRQDFSSLMFLEETPPRLTRRSRLDDLPLLLLRALALLLLAAAFTRPFLRGGSSLVGSDGGRLVVLAVDASASMRRDGLREAALAEAEAVLDSLGPGDRAALLTFSAEPRFVVDFSDSDAESQRQQIRQALEGFEPSWGSTDLGRALVRAAERLRERASEDEASAAAATQIVLISDLQEGADRNALQGFEWPAEVPVEVRAVRAADASNASLRLIADELGEESQTAEPLPLRVRVSNTSDAAADEFAVAWRRDGSEVDASEGDGSAGDGQSFVVPAGESRVRELAPDPSASVLRLTGDAADFDNRLFVAPPQPRTVRVRYFGEDDRDDPEGSLFYLSRAIAETPLRAVEVVTETGGGPAQLTAVTTPLDRSAMDAVLEDVRAGGTLIVVPPDAQTASKLEPLIGPTRAVESGGEAADRLLAEIDFASSLFAPFDGPRFNDFTDVRFWRAAAAEPAGEAAVLARFDDGLPAVWSRPIGQGTVFVFTSGWRPGDSQLALSNKFVPLVEQMLAAGMPRELPRLGYSVGDVVPIDRAGEGVVVVRPGGSESKVNEDGRFTGADRPGVYEVRRGDDVSRFAVNVPAAESRTTPFDADTLSQFGVRLGVAESTEDRAARERLLRDRELEGRQKLWKWLIAAAAVMIGLEMWLSGRRARQLFVPPQ